MNNTDLTKVIMTYLNYQNPIKSFKYIIQMAKDQKANIVELLMIQNSNNLNNFLQNLVAQKGSNSGPKGFQLLDEVDQFSFKLYDVSYFFPQLQTTVQLQNLELVKILVKKTLHFHLESEQKLGQFVSNICNFFGLEFYSVLEFICEQEFEFTLQKLFFKGE